MLDEKKKTNIPSRRLSTFEFFEIIQVEYICALLRAKIYTKTKDKIFWNKVMEGKRVTINEISERNQLPTIFTDQDLSSALNRRVYRENTYPFFLYKDENQRLSQEFYDMFYYYSKGADVRFPLNGEIQVGKVKSYKPLDKTITLEIKNGEELKVETAIVVRIL